MKNRTTSDNITELNDDEIFVFGSNEAGLHGAGAAFIAMPFGAELYKGFGFAGNTFAIPTKDWEVKTLPLEAIEHYVNRFIAACKVHKDLNFLVTKIGCGLAGYQVGDIAPFFKDAVELSNVFLPEEFWNYLGY